ncbi:FeoA family protein [Xylophilus sp. ASV27]|uniref:FeoA family protein n=1 Tax=Xylophilus sp. ASV27 TaxID=2795129 RepID=UPI0018EBAD35|nr:FeoA family protein [Xylophilus sp. ASV27]
MPLAELPRNVLATIAGLRQPVDAEQSDLLLRLIEIGFVPGERVRVVAHGFPGREPLAVRLGHTTFALRMAEAALIDVLPGNAP